LFDEREHGIRPRSGRVARILIWRSKTPDPCRTPSCPLSRWDWPRGKAGRERLRPVASVIVDALRVTAVVGKVAVNVVEVLKGNADLPKVVPGHGPVGRFPYFLDGGKQ